MGKENLAIKRATNDQESPVKKVSKVKELVGSSKVNGIEGKFDIRNSRLPLWVAVANTMKTHKKTMVGAVSRNKEVANSAKLCGIRGNDSRHQAVLTICRNLSHFGILQQTNPRLPMFKVNNFKALQSVATQATEILATLVEAPKPVKTKRKQRVCSKCSKPGHNSTTCGRPKVVKAKKVTKKATPKKTQRSREVAIQPVDLGGWMLESGVDINKLAELLALVEKCGGFKHLEEILTDDMFVAREGIENLTETELATGELDSDFEDLEGQWDALSVEFGDSIVTTL